MAIGTPGSDGIWQHLVQVIANVIDFGMDVQTAITVPRMRVGGRTEAGKKSNRCFLWKTGFRQRRWKRCVLRGTRSGQSPSLGW